MDDYKPCDNIHSLPCGLDIACPVPTSYFYQEDSSKEIWEAYQEDKEE